MSSAGMPARMTLVARTVLVACVLAPASARSAAQEPPPSEPSQSGGAAHELSGFVSTRWHGRFADGSDDHDLLEIVAIDGKLGRLGHPPDSGELEITWRLFAQANADLDGDEDPQSAFYGLSDTYDGDLTAALHEAWIEVAPRASLMHPRGRLRLGRQQLWDTPEFAFIDGLAAETRELSWKRLSFGVYGGVAVHPYASSPAGGSIEGLYAELAPWTGARARADYMRAESSALLGPEQSDLAQLALWQHLGEALVLEGAHGRLDGEPRDLRAAARWLDAERALSVEARWYRLLEPQSQLAVPFDPFESALTALEPYEELGLLAWKAFGERWSANGGYDRRRLLDQDDESDFNHEYARLFASVSWQPRADTSVALGGERLETDEIEGFSTWSVDLRRDLSDRWTVGVGSAFALYKHDVLDQEEREDVRTTWIELRAKASGEHLRWRARYELEDGEDDTFHLLRLEATWEL